MLQWVKFFLQAIDESAADAVETINLLAACDDENIRKLEGMPRNQNLRLLFAYLERNPIIEIKKTAEDIGVAYNTVSKAVKTLVNHNILVESRETGRTRIFSYEKYLDILRKDTLGE